MYVPSSPTPAAACPILLSMVFTSHPSLSTPGCLQLESVVSALKKRYGKKLAKMQELWASEKEVLLTTLSAPPPPPAHAFHPPTTTSRAPAVNGCANARETKLRHLMQARFLDY